MPEAREKTIQKRPRDPEYVEILKGLLAQSLPPR